jgi:hypothetical protein
MPQTLPQKLFGSKLRWRLLFVAALVFVAYQIDNAPAAADGTIHFHVKHLIVIHEFGKDLRVKSLEEINLLLIVLKTVFDNVIFQLQQLFTQKLHHLFRYFYHIGVGAQSPFFLLDVGKHLFENNFSHNNKKFLVTVNIYQTKNTKPCVIILMKKSRWVSVKNYEAA